MKKLILVLLTAFMLCGCDVIDIAEGVLTNQIDLINKTKNSIKNATGGYVLEDGTLYITQDMEPGLNNEMPWHSNASKIKSIVVEEGVTKLCAFMFEWCNECESVTLPESLIEIGSYVFYGCDKLKHINLPENLLCIGYNAFSNCGIEKIFIPSSVEYIGEGMFGYSNRLYEIVIDENNPNYSSCGCNVIYDVQNKTVVAGCATSVIPEETETIGYFAFDNIRLTEIVIPPTVKQIADFAFAGTEIETITIPSSVTYIGYYCFNFCEYLKSITFEAGSESIYLDDSCFEDCNSLISINLNGRPFEGNLDYLDSDIEIIY